MNRLAKLLASGMLGTVLIAPCAMAQSRQDMRGDEHAIHENREQIHNDRDEQREDLRNGNFGAARDEQREINERRDQIQDQRRDLDEDMVRRERHHHERDDD